MYISYKGLLSRIYEQLLWLKNKNMNKSIFSKKVAKKDFPGDPVVKNLPANARDTVSILCLWGFCMSWGNKTQSQLLSSCAATAQISEL